MKSMFCTAQRHNECEERGEKHSIQPFLSDRDRRPCGCGCHTKIMKAREKIFKLATEHNLMHYNCGEEIILRPTSNTTAYQILWLLHQLRTTGYNTRVRADYSIAVKAPHNFDHLWDVEFGWNCPVGFSPGVCENEHQMKYR